MRSSWASHVARLLRACFCAAICKRSQCTAQRGPDVLPAMFARPVCPLSLPAQFGLLVCPPCLSALFACPFCPPNLPAHSACPLEPTAQISTFVFPFLFLSAWGTKMDTLGIEPRASRMLSGCDTTTPRALDKWRRRLVCRRCAKAFHLFQLAPWTRKSRQGMGKQKW